MSDTQSSMSAVKPAEKPTVQMEKAPEWAIYINDQMRKGFERVDKRQDAQDERLDKIEQQVAISADTYKDHNKRITSLEILREQDEKRAEKASQRIGHESSANLKQDAVIAEVLNKVNAINDKPDTADLVIAEIKDAAKTPMGQKLIGAAAGVALLVLGLVSVSLQAKMAQLEAKPMPAPTVVVQLPAHDGGVQ